MVPSIIDVWGYDREFCSSSPSPSSSGVIVALLGTEMKGGVFEVENYTFAGLPSQEESTETEDQEEEERLVALTYSNLEINKKGRN